jgi:hypothetical protein
MLISTPGYSLSLGRAVSLLVAFAPAGSHLSRSSHRSLAPSVPINFLSIVKFNKNLFNDLLKMILIKINDFGIHFEIRWNIIKS